MENIKYKIREDYESICETINIIGLEEYDILNANEYSVKNLWGHRIIKIDLIEDIDRSVNDLPSKLTDPEYGNIKLDRYLQNSADDSITIEDIRNITDKLPSLTEVLIDERHDEK